MKRYLLGFSLLLLAGSVGCPMAMRTPDGNDNAAANDNAVANDNDSANVNDNAAANENDNVDGNDNEDDNENDNSGGGTERDFTEFMFELFDSTADDTEPVSIDDVTFIFDEDPAAFDDLIEEAAE